MEKLREKKQSEKQRPQAHYAVTLYFECAFRVVDKVTNNRMQEQNITGNQSFPNRSETFCQENKELKSVTLRTQKLASVMKKKISITQGADWTGVYDDLKNAIKVCHYSPSTLKTYVGWTRKFQTYTKSKGSLSLTVDDVKGF